MYQIVTGKFNLDVTVLAVESGSTTAVPGYCKFSGPRKVVG